MRHIIDAMKPGTTCEILLASGAKITGRKTQDCESYAAGWLAHFIDVKEGRNWTIVGNSIAAVAVIAKYTAMPRE